MLDYFISFAMLDLTLINKSLYFMLPVYIMIAKIYLNIFHWIVNWVPPNEDKN